MTPYGVYMRCDADDLTNFFALSGKPDVDYRDVYDEVVKLQPNNAFIDIGANAGLFSLVAGRALGLTGPVISFEPSILNFARLIDNATLNELKEFYPFRLALGDRTERTQLTERATHTGTSHLTTTGGSPVLKASYDDLSGLIDPLIEGRDIIIKIDVEGAELMVVSTIAKLLARDSVKAVIIEVDRKLLGRFGATPEELYAKFEMAGLKPRRGIATAPHFNEVFERTAT